MVWAACAPDCMATSATAGQVVQGHHVAHHEHLGVPRYRAVGVHPDAATAVDGDAGILGEPGGEGRSAGPGRPDLGRSRDLFDRPIGLGDAHAVGVHPGDHRPEVDLDAQSGQVPPGDAGKPLAHGGHQRVTALDQDDAGLRRVDAPIVAPKGPTRELLELPRHLNPGGPAADHDEGHQCSAPVIIGFGFGFFEGAEDLAAEVQGVVQRLHARRLAPEVVVTEVRGDRPSGNNETVVADGDRVVELGDGELAGDRIDVLHLTQDDAHGGVVAEDVADSRGDLTFRKDSGGHLVEEWLEEMVIGAVDQGDPHRYPPEGLGGEQATEARADDHHMVPLVNLVVDHTNSLMTSSTYRATGRCSSSPRVNHRTSSVVPFSSGRSVPVHLATR